MTLIPYHRKAKPPSLMSCDGERQVERVHALIAPYFARPETRLRALAYLQAILSDLPRKNGWQIAEQAREARPDGMQRLLTSAVWSADRVRDELRAYILQRFGDPQAIVVIDETSFPKRGKHSAGVARQYCGTSGEPANCQVGVFLSYVGEKGHTLLDRELYIPDRWFTDPQRCQQAGIPETTGFQTKCELARTMVKRLLQAGVPMRWVVADCVYGSNQDLREDLERHGIFYGLGVRCDEAVEIMTPLGRTRMTVAEAEARFLGADDWQRLSMGNGTKGPRSFDWACLPMLSHGQEDGQHWLLMRREISDPTKKRYYFVFGPTGTTLAEMVEAIGARWKIEEDFETGKDIGLDQYEVRTWIAWYRHVTLVLVALAALSGICAHEQSAQRAEPDRTSQERPLLPLTRPEVAHLLGQLIWPHPHNAPLLLAWSWWRRCHCSRASFCHAKRRLQAG
ncbi:MAG TPA: IS701 family transposase [Ktedonobacteraceae bacterium]|nr:IS701 family transposase [Ktedonobacteraceae bacterium]